MTASTIGATAPTLDAGGTRTQHLPLASIVRGLNNRTTFGTEDLASLAESIRTSGLAQPVIVRPYGAGYQLVAGERRLRAHELLGLETIEAVVRELSDREAHGITLLENLARVDPDPFDEAEGYSRHMSEYGATAAEVAAEAGVSTFRVSERLRLLRVTAEARVLVKGGSLPLGHAARMADLDGNRQALMLAAWEQSGGSISRAGWSAMVAERQAEQDQESMFDAAAFLQVAEMVAGAARREPSTKALRRHLQAAVRVLEAAGLAPELCAEIRGTWARSWAIAEVKAS